ncbi:hypothetical protein BpHYR1_018843 [Brachionus plicatilis]|uniref:Uncharacterized protein n=1 Tax=Brachionus plicatilis TaxID=10195 RepID=A0A3M7PQY0_BRAPC|nr:hypothetical protein BpHYR1_018843 [Brachionus plicatilis]
MKRFVNDNGQTLGRFVEAGAKKFKFQRIISSTHLLNRIKRTSIITKKFFGSSRLGELWFIYSWNNFCSQCAYQKFQSNFFILPLSARMSGAVYDKRPICNFGR